MSAGQLWGEAAGVAAILAYASVLGVAVMEEEVGIMEGEDLDHKVRVEAAELEWLGWAVRLWIPRAAWLSRA
jgi:hypothetical protein